MLHYEQIQYEFCSKEHIFSPGNDIMQHMTHRQFLYMYSIIMARYWDQMKATTVEVTVIMKIYLNVLLSCPQRTL